MQAITCNIRDNCGTSNARRLRREGFIPATLSFSNKPTMNLVVSAYDIMMLRKQKYLSSTPITLEIGGDNFIALAAKCTFHPIKDTIEHIEFIADNEQDKVLSVPLFYDNLDKSPGHKRSGFFNITRRTLKIKGRIAGMPRSLIKDVGDLETGVMIRASDIDLPAGYTLAEKDPKIVIATMRGKGGGAQAAEAAK